MTTPTPPSGIFDRNKRNQRRAFSSKQDVYWRYGRLLHEAEKNRTSIERLLHVARLALTFFTDILRPSEEFEDVPVHSLGSHLLTHRNIESGANGLEDRVLVQEICSMDSKEEPRERKYPGNEIATFSVSIDPESHTTRENLLSMQAHLKVELNGTATVTFTRHGEQYTFNFPKLIFHEPLSAECTLSLKGKVEVGCSATGLSIALLFASNGAVKGTVRQLAGNGYTNICAIYGRWDDQITVTSSEKGTQGILFAADDTKPAISPKVDLSNITGRCLHRVWTILHDALIYTDPSKSKSKAGERLCTALMQWMKSLMPESVVITPATMNQTDEHSETDADNDNGQKDGRNIPPCIKEAHNNGNKAHYRLECRLKAFDHDELILASTYVPTTAAASLTEYWKRQKALVAE